MRRQVLKFFIEDLPKVRTPILTHSRQLLKTYPGNTKVEYYRKTTPDVQVIVNSIEDASKLSVLEDELHGPRCVKYRGPSETIKRMKNEKIKGTPRFELSPEQTKKDLVGSNSTEGS